MTHCLFPCLVTRHEIRPSVLPRLVKPLVQCVVYLILEVKIGKLLLEHLASVMHAQLICASHPLRWQRRQRAWITKAVGLPRSTPMLYFVNIVVQFCSWFLFRHTSILKYYRVLHRNLQSQIPENLFVPAKYPIKATEVWPVMVTCASPCFTASSHGWLPLDLCSASWLFFCTIVGQFEKTWPWHVTFQLLCLDVWQGQTNVLWFTTASFYTKLCKAAHRSNPSLIWQLELLHSAKWYHAKSKLWWGLKGCQLGPSFICCCSFGGGECRGRSWPASSHGVPEQMRVR